MSKVSMKTTRLIIARAIIGPIFISLFCMHHMQSELIREQTSTITQIVNNSANNSINIDEVTNAYKDINSSNANFFNVLLAIFAAWGGAIIAFYFGSENLEQAQKTIEKVVQNNNNNNNDTKIVKIEDVINNAGSSRRIAELDKNSTIDKAAAKFENVKNILIIDENGKPFGILYQDIFENNKKDAKNISDIIKKLDGKEDEITKEKWSERHGIVNYAKLSLQDNKAQAITKLTEKCNNLDKLSAMRALVFDDESTPVAILSHKEIAEYGI